MKKFGKIIYNTLVAISVALMIWFLASYIDIIADNTEPNPKHSDYNLIIMIFGEKEERV